MGKKTGKILDAVEKILKRQEKMISAAEEKQESWADAVPPQMAGLMDQMQKLTCTLEEWQKTQQEGLERLTGTVGKHDLALTDLIESWEEIQESHQQEISCMQADREAEWRQEMSQVRAREKNLLELEMGTLDQLFVLQKAADGLPAWQEQLRMIRSSLASRMQKARLAEISEAGMPVDYDLHEVVEVRTTSLEAQHATVAEVYQNGYQYQGKVIRKARVASWKYQGNVEEA